MAEYTQTLYVQCECVVTAEKCRWSNSYRPLLRTAVSSNISKLQVKHSLE